MEFRNYLGYSIYKNGDVENNKGLILKPKIKNKYCFYNISGKRISAGQLVLLSFGILPKHTKQKVYHKDGNFLNNSLENLIWK
jgi:hypothetical protein